VPKPVGSTTVLLSDGQRYYVGPAVRCRLNRVCVMECTARCNTSEVLPCYGS